MAIFNFPSAPNDLDEYTLNSVTYVYNATKTRWEPKDITNSLLDHIAFDTTAGYSVGEGELAWNADEGTVDIGILNGSVLQVGQEVVYLVKNQTGSTIPNGTPVMATGTLGASGRITVAPMVSDGSVEPRFFLGVTTNEILDGEDGYVTHLGKVRGVDLTAFANGDVLWLDPTVVGGLTSTEPTTAGALKIAVAFVIYDGNGNASQGVMQVRFTDGTHLHEAHDVSITAPSNGDVLSYDSVSGLWINSTETDPIFSASAAFGITETQVTNWDTAFTWGDHGEAGYLTAETDTLGSVTTRGAVTTNSIETSGFVTTGGTSSDFVKGDGSLDSTTYLNSYTETQTLQDVTDLGATTTADVTVGTLHSDVYTYKTDHPLLSKPSYAEGKVFYDPEYKTLTLYNEEPDMALQLGQEFVVRVYNSTGSTIPIGTPCRASGTSGELQTVEPADATTQGLARVFGVATHDIPSGSTGYLTKHGFVSGINTSGLTQGKPVFLAPDGSLTSQAATYPYYPTQIGGCVVSDATDGYLYVEPVYFTQDQLRVIYNGHIDGNLTVNGDLVINGTQSITNQQNLAINDSFIYLNSGDNIGEAGTTFTGSGLDDAYFTGYYEGTSNQTYYVRIDSVGGGTGGVDTFEWSLDNFSTTEATGVDITGDNQALVDNINIYFNATTGHTLNDVWSGTAVPVNIDTGWVTNRNTGTSGIGHTHLGVFYDVSDEKFRIFDEYAPEPNGGNIDVNDASYNTGTIVANIEGNVTGDVTGNADTATALATAQNITLTGDVTGTASFDGTATASITTSLSATYLTDITGQPLGDLSNVSLTSPTNGQVLKYNGTNWVNATEAGGGITTGKAIAMAMIFG